VLFRHLMVPVDLSDRDDRALRMAQALAADRRTRVTLLHVVQRVPEIAVRTVPRIGSPLPLPGEDLRKEGFKGFYTMHALRRAISV